MKKIFLTSAICLLTSYIFSQVDLGIPASTGKGGVGNGILYDWECVGVNPANLGWEKNHRFSISAVIFSISAQSKALDYGQLKNAIIHPGDTFSQADKANYAKLFSNPDGLNLQSNMNWLTMSFHFPKVGGFAMNLRDRTFGHVTLNKNAAEILFMGSNAPIFKDTMFWLSPKNISTVFDGSKIGYTHYRELNLAYGTKLFGIGGTHDSSAVSFYGGIGVKYLWGMGNFEMIAENGVLTGHSSISSKYGVNYGNIKNFTPENSSGIFPSVGGGTAMDLGLGVGIGKIKITLSAVDIGKITWNKNVLIAQDTLMPDTSKFMYGGINSWDMAQQASHMFNDSGLVKFKPGKSYSTALASKFRVGVGYQISKRMIAGADIVMPISNNPANLENAFFAVGMETELASNFKIAFGFAGNRTYGFSLPMGVTLGHFFKIMEVGIATNDILTYLSPGSNPNISLTLSMFRFNVNQKK